MTRTITNEFSWSLSREQTLSECPRRYYYSYYGHWGGWEENADPRRREIWLLKRVQTRHMWIGDLVHRVVAFALQFARMHGGVPDLADLERRFDALMRQEFRDSRDDLLRNGNADSVRLFEHEFDETLEGDVWQILHRRGLTAIRNFVRGDLLPKILSVPVSRWMELEDRQSFVLDEVSVYVKLDFAYMDGPDLHIVDWKTGARPAAANTTQLACYALYAKDRWGFTLGHIRTIEMNLVRNELAERTISDEEIDEAARTIWRSARVMRERLEDPAQNTAREEDFGRIESLPVCRRCAFQRPCLGDRAERVLTRAGSRAR